MFSEPIFRCHALMAPNVIRSSSLGRKTKKEDNLSIVFFSTPSGARTLDPNIKSVVLYQLS